MTKLRTAAAAAFPPAYFGVLAVIWTWPLVLHMKNSVAGQIGDNLQFAWQAGWLAHLLRGGSGTLYFAPNLNYPAGWPLASSEMSLIQAAIALPGTLLGGALLGYNLAMLFSFALGGWGMYLWVRRLTGGSKAISLPGLIAGTAYACLPFWYAHFLAGHLDLAGMQWFPFYFWGLFDLLQGNQGKQPVLLAGISLGLIALTSQYYFFMTVFCTVVISAVFLAAFNRRTLWTWSFWKQAGFTLLVALPLVGVAIWPFLTLTGAGGLPNRDIEFLRGYAARLEDFFVPATSHFLWGEWIGSHFNRSHWIEGTLYLGVPASFLFISGAISGLRKNLTRPLLLLLLLLAGCGFILALGPDFHLFNQPAPYPPFERLQNWLNERGALYLPGSLFVKYVPFYAKMRAVRRFGALLLAGICAGAGLGASHWLGRVSGRRRNLAAGVMLGVILLDFYPARDVPFARVEPRPVDAWLADQPGTAGVVQMPFSRVVDQEFTFYTLTNHKPFMGGQFNAFPPTQYLQARPVLDAFPDLPSIRLLQELGVEYVVIHANDYPDFPSIQAVLEDLGLVQAYSAAGDYVYVLGNRLAP